FPDAPWVKLADQGPPHVQSAIYPASQFLKLKPPPYQAAIDPLALILAEDIYVRLTLPDPPPIDIWTRELAAAARVLTPAQRKTALARLTMFRETYLAVAQRVLSEAGLSKKG